MKKIYIFLMALVLPAMLWAQVISTEDFEDETIGSTSFTSNAQIFNIISQGNSFDIYSNDDGLGWNGTAKDNNFIDNSSHGNLNTPVEFTIATNGSVPFQLKSMWLYYANFNLEYGSGTISIKGMLAGNEVFNATESLNSPNSSVNNGYTKFDLSSYGGADNANQIIDAFVITTTGNLAYVGLDALTWATVDVATPVDLKNFSGFVTNGTAHLQWNTGVETQFDHYEIEKSGQNGKYATIESFVPKGNNSDYSFSVLQAEASADYRLKIVDKSGVIHYSRQITLSENGDGKTAIYPNPAHDYINVRVTNAGSVTINDALGRQVKTASLQQGVNVIDISGLSAGIYYAKVGKEKISFVKK